MARAAAPVYRTAMRVSFAQAAWINLALAGMEALVEQYTFAVALALLAVVLFGVHWRLKQRRRANWSDDARMSYWMPKAYAERSARATGLARLSRQESLRATTTEPIPTGASAPGHFPTSRSASALRRHLSPEAQTGRLWKSTQAASRRYPRRG